LSRRVDGWPEIIGLNLEADVDADSRLRAPWCVRDVVINWTSLRRLPCDVFVKLPSMLGVSDRTKLLRRHSQRFVAPSLSG